MEEGGWYIEFLARCIRSRNPHQLPLLKKITVLKCGLSGFSCPLGKIPVLKCVGSCPLNAFGLSNMMKNVLFENN
jgi:hypothetical protein